MTKFLNTWEAVAARPFTFDGTKAGRIALASTAGFYVNQIVFVKATGLDTKTLQIKRVVSKTLLIVGPVDDNKNRVSAVDYYTVALGATIEAGEQPIALDIESGEMQESVYENSPIAAIRTRLVDDTGDGYSSVNPLPVSLASGSGSSFVPSDFDDVQITLDADEDPTLYTFYKNMVNIGGVQVFYNSNKTSYRYKKVP